LQIHYNLLQQHDIRDCKGKQTSTIFGLCTWLLDYPI
jgi:hypothetical protein